MHDKLLKLYVKFQNLVSSEQGEDIVEFAFLVLLIALALVSASNLVAEAVNNVFTNLSTSLA